MKTWIQRGLLGLFSIGLLAGGLSACANHSRFGHGGPMTPERVAEMRAKVIERVSGKLELNTEQKQKLAVLADTLQAQRQALVGTSPEPRAAMQALVAGEKFDRAGAQALLDSKTRAVQAGSPQVIAAMADFYDSLTPQQQQQVREQMQKRRGAGWLSRG